MNQYHLQWNWSLLPENKSFPWSIELIDYVRKKTGSILFVNNAQYKGQYIGLYDKVFKTQSSHEFIDEIMSEINLDNEIYLFSL
jgi:hypothetical protein